MSSLENPPCVKDKLLRCGFAAEQCMGMAHSADPLSPSLIWACCKNKDLSRGRQIHHELHQRGLLEKNYSDALITMYAKCGELQKAQTLLDMHNSTSIIPWTALIAGYARHGQGNNALDCFDQMQLEGISPNAVTYVCLLKACAVIRALDKGKQIHNEISRQGLLEQHIVLGNALVDMYAKCGALSQAQSVLEKLPSRDVFSWSALIAGYAQKGQGQKALECFEQMEHDNIPPNAVTYVSMLQACAMIGAIDKGKQIHEEISKQGLLEHSVALGGALVDMYAKCGALLEAQSTFEMLPSRDVVSWSALISGYAQKGQGQQALECFRKMQHEGIPPNSVTYVSLLKACAAIGAIDKGKQFYDEISRRGLLEHSTELGSAIVDMYAQCDALSQAQSVLEKLPLCNITAWNALLTGYVQKGKGQQALECYEQTVRKGVRPDAVTYVCILKACAAIGAFDKGKQFHDEISSQGLLEHQVELGGALVDMYAKCGALAHAQRVLEKLPFRNVISWNSLIAGYAQEGQGEEALKCFGEMQHEGIVPDVVTFISLLNLCSHLGLVEKGQELFDNMRVMHGLEPDVECFACMVDLLARAGHLLKAVQVIQAMPFSATSEIWLCLLGASQKWVDVKLGTWAFKGAVEVDECDATAYIIMANLYAAAGMPQKAKDIEAMRIKITAWKQSGCAFRTNSAMHKARRLS